MDKILKLLENMQLWVCVVVGVLLIATLSLLFGFSPENDSKKIKAELFELSEAIRSQYQKKPDYWGLNKNVIVQFAPKKMVINDKVVSATGREFIVGRNENGDIIMPSQRNFMITLANLNKKTCLNIATLDVDGEKNLSLQKVILRSDKEAIEFEWGKDNNLPISKENAKKYCTNKSSISWIFE